MDVSKTANDGGCPYCGWLWRPDLLDDQQEKLVADGEAFMMNQAEDVTDVNEGVTFGTLTRNTEQHTNTVHIGL